MPSGLTSRPGSCLLTTVTKSSSMIQTSGRASTTILLELLVKRAALLGIGFDGRLVHQLVRFAWSSSREPLTNTVPCLIALE